MQGKAVQAERSAYANTELGKRWVRFECKVVGLGWGPRGFPGGGWVGAIRGPILGALQAW